MIHPTCRKAGHRWSAPIRADRHRWWIEIRRCLRRGCARMRYEDDTGQAFTYDLVDGVSTNRKVVAK